MTGQVRGRLASLAPIIGRWITLGETADLPDVGKLSVTTSDIYEWAGNGSHVLHQAYGLAGGQPGGGTEIIRHDPETGQFACHFFDNEGGVITQTLTVEERRWTWEGGDRRCRAELSQDKTTLVAHHEAATDAGWVPTAEVVLHRAG